MSSKAIRFTQEAQHILRSAEVEALQRHSLYVDVEHILLALLAGEEQPEPLKSIWGGVERSELSATLSRELGMVREDTPWKKADGYTQSSKSLLERATLLAQAMGQRTLNSGHLVLAMFDAPSELVQRVLQDAGVKSEQVRHHVQQISPELDKLAPPPEPLIVLQEHRQPRRPASRPSSRLTAAPPIDRMWYYILAALVGVFIYLTLFNRPALISFGIVLGGWIFSLTLHEFSHAIVAYWGGDYTVKDKGYLSFNPLRYANPLLSFVLPVLFLLLGGIGLPGGAVYIEEHRLRSPWWRTAVSLAGPASNVLMAVVFAMPFIVGVVEVPDHLFVLPSSVDRWEGALAALVMLQLMAVLLNLLPIPPLDGFNALSPFMPPPTVQSLRQLGFISLLIIFYAFRIPAFNNAFFDAVQAGMDFLHVPWNMAVQGLRFFNFW